MDRLGIGFLCGFGLPPVEFVKPGEAPAPLPPRDQPPAAWVTRPEDYLRQVAPPPQLRAPGQIHRVAGILLILSALVAVGWTIALSIRFLTPAQYENATAGLTPEAWAIGQICGLLGICFCNHDFIIRRTAPMNAAGIDDDRAVVRLQAHACMGELGELHATTLILAPWVSGPWSAVH